MSLGEKVYPVMVQRTVAGRPLSAVLPHAAVAARHDLLVETGEVVARLNSVPVDLEREWTADQRFPRAARRQSRDTIVAAGFTVEEADTMFGLVEDHVAASAGPPWVLCHGDLSTAHLYATVDGSGRACVSGLIDFGDWLPGVPAHDLAVLRVRSPSLPLDPILDGYGRGGDAGLRRKLDLQTLMAALDTLHFGVSERDNALIGRVGTLIRRVCATSTSEADRVGAGEGT